MKSCFQRPLETFLYTLRSCLSYREGSFRLVLHASKKSCPYDTPIRLCVRKSEKSLYFEKWSPKCGWNILVKPAFLRWNFFPRASRTFSTQLTIMFKVYKTFSKNVSLRSENNWGYTIHTSENIYKKRFTFQKPKRFGHSSPDTTEV